jgi:DNA-binding IclR family transcriptional regulator
METSKNTVPNIEKAIVIIELLSNHKDGLTLQNLIDETKLAKTTVFRILNTFTNYGYIYKAADNSFSLTKKFLHLGLSAMGDVSLIEKSLDIMKQLRDTVNETVLLGALVDDKIMMLEQVIGNEPFTFYLKPNKQIMLHASAPGKAYLAFCDKQEKERLMLEMDMPKYNKNTITDKGVLQNNLAQIKEQGYAIDCAEELEGVHCIGAPVFSYNGLPIALLWTTGPSARIPKEKFKEYGALVKDHALKISNKLGYNV